MSELKTISWLVWLLVSIWLVFHFIGFGGLCAMFPEGKRAWHLPAQLASLAIFAAAILCNPWSLK
ncbi:hypothetical protein [Solimicrobium silvestre]|uniref:Uncharacterized protein n=1 Tax=Solimicrobium silvestre TaxID=2099400 RepID=A0A2S9GY40_9BURK|nr:hypothetical protein [Solimicrobium silvestre]PRC92620.1 hypothetical protein S2091_2675 [Solimicrobium silvestre]